MHIKANVERLSHTKYEIDVGETHGSTVYGFALYIRAHIYGGWQID